MILIDKALKYHNAGFSIIPIDSKKRPIGPWAESQIKPVNPENRLTDAHGIGIVCGQVSGNLEMIDIDCKYDLTGNLYEDYCKSITEINPDIIPKMVIQTTVNGGYHFIYRCSEIEGNKKLASRYTTDDEKVKNPDEKRKILIETRGEGGFFACVPTEGYLLGQGLFSKINTITPAEREILMNCARRMNQITELAPVPKRSYDGPVEEGAFEDYNNKCDAVGLLESYGWKVTLRKKDKIMLLRPGGEGTWSGDWCEKRRVFFVFSTSTEFENDKGYNPVQILAKLKFNDDFSACSKWLYDNGYGTRKQKTTIKNIAHVNTYEDDNDYSFIAPKEDIDSYIVNKRNGTFKMGNKTGFVNFDPFFRFKDASLVMLLGHDNVGKSVVSWYLATLDALFNNESWIVFAGENKTGGVKSKVCEFYIGKSINKMTDDEYNKASSWFDEHFTIINNDEMYSYSDMLAMGRKLLKKKKYGKFLIDPYNALAKETSNEHQYDYKAMLEFRLFIKQTGCGIYLNVHAATEALRRLYPKEHVHFGYTMPPKKADTEGGGKFPNKADDFLVIHRMPEHESEWMWTEIHVRKIKEMETGGKQTFLNDPFKIKMIPGACGFEDAKGQNPIREYWDGLSQSPADKHIEPVKKEEPELTDEKF